MAIEPGASGGGEFEGEDADEDASPAVEEESELDDKDSGFLIGSSVSVESSSSVV